jgi:hypothetical protein
MRSRHPVPARRRLCLPPRSLAPGSCRRVRCAAALVAALSMTACTSPDYTYARESRHERPYRGGAASVPDEEPADPNVKAPTPFDAFAFFGFVALLFTRPESYSPGRPQSQFGPAPPPPPPQTK